MRRTRQADALLPRSRLGGGFAAIAATFAMLPLAACDPEPGPPATVVAEKPLAAIGVSVGSLRDPFFTAIAHGVEAEARRGDPPAQVTIVGDDYSALRQIEQIDDFVARHVDLILLTPADPEQIADAIGRAHAAGIVVVALDTAAQGADAQVGTDNVAAGALACGALAERLGGHGSVAIIGGPPAAVVAARTQGCTDTLARQPGISIVASDKDGEGTRDGGRHAMHDILAEQTQLDAVFAVADPEALGAADAAGDAGRSVIIASVDGSPAIEAALANRARASIIATAAQDPYRIGRNAVRVGDDLRHGRTPQPEALLLAPMLVTRETVHDYKGWLAERE